MTDRAEVLTATFAGVEYVLIRNEDRPGYHCRTVESVTPEVDASLLWSDPELDVLQSIHDMAEKLGAPRVVQPPRPRIVAPTREDA